MKKKDRYLVGYADGIRTVWGRDRHDQAGWVDTMPLKEAKKVAKKTLTSIGIERVVYKLVPVVKVGRRT